MGRSMKQNDCSVAVMSELIQQAAKDGDGYLSMWLLRQAYEMLSDGPSATYDGILSGDIVTLEDVEEMLGVSQSQAGRNVALLVSLGLVEKLPVVQEGRRHLLLCRTALAPTKAYAMTAKDWECVDSVR
jgi:DNA-binding MarR family transcriptional regulator